MKSFYQYMETANFDYHIFPRFTLESNHGDRLVLQLKSLMGKVKKYFYCHDTDIGKVIPKALKYDDSDSSYYQFTIKKDIPNENLKVGDLVNAWTINKEQFGVSLFDESEPYKYHIFPSSDAGDILEPYRNTFEDLNAFTLTLQEHVNWLLSDKKIFKEFFDGCVEQFQYLLGRKNMDYNELSNIKTLSFIAKIFSNLDDITPIFCDWLANEKDIFDENRYYEVKQHLRSFVHEFIMLLMPTVIQAGDL